MEIDPDYEIIHEQCRRLVGKEFVLSISFDSMVLPIGECPGLNNAVGSILEETIFLLLKKILPHIERGPKQKSPDYYNRGKYEYELKTFEKNAGFDISSYNAYIEQIIQENGLYRKIFDTKYLVFRYSLSECRIKIQRFWMLNIWNMINYTGKYPISIQNKHGVWFNIRPSSENGWTDKKREAKKFIHNLIESIRSCPIL